MAFCEECGANIPDGATQCPACGATVMVKASRQSNGAASPSQLNQGATVKGLNNLVLAENEKVVRQYKCSQIKRPSCTGYLTVTNKRIIFMGKAADSRVEKEVVLDSVSGLDCYYGRNVNIVKLLVGALLSILGLIITVRILQSYWIEESFAVAGVALLIAGLIIAFTSIQRSFFLSVYSSKASGTPISLGAGPRSLIGNSALYTLASEPTADTDRMLNELGALVQDLQTLGDHAIEKWSI